MGMMAHTFNPCSREAEALWVQSQSGELWDSQGYMTLKTNKNTILLILGHRFVRLSFLQLSGAKSYNLQFLVQATPETEWLLSLFLRGKKSLGTCSYYDANI